LFERIFSKILSKRGTVSFFFTKKKKNEKEVGKPAA